MKSTASANRYCRILGAVALATFSATLLSSCSPASEVDELAIVSGVRTGSPVIPAALVRSAMEKIDSKGDRVVVVSVEGTPRVVFDHRVTDLPPNDLDRADYLEDRGRLVEEAVVASASLSAEADVAEAIALAASAFDRAAGSRTISVFDSMLATAGSLSMLDGALYDAAEDRVGALADAGGLLDLEGVRVEVARLGVTAAPQEALTADARESLKGQWERYLERSGAQVVFNSDAQSAEAWVIGALPPVTPVPITRPAPIVSGCQAALPDAAIGFLPDSAEFIDARAARAIVTEVAPILRNCDGAIVVSGSTSSAGTQSSSVPLAEARALAVAGPLAEALGIDVRDIEIRGYGAEWPCRVDDRDSVGNLVEALARQNRVVVISRGVDANQCS